MENFIPFNQYNGQIEKLKLDFAIEVHQQEKKEGIHLIACLPSIQKSNEYLSISTQHTAKDLNVLTQSAPAHLEFWLENIDFLTKYNKKRNKNIIFSSLMSDENEHEIGIESYLNATEKKNPFLQIHIQKKICGHELIYTNHFYQNTEKNQALFTYTNLEECLKNQSIQQIPTPIIFYQISEMKEIEKLKKTFILNIINLINK